MRKAVLYLLVIIVHISACQVRFVHYRSISYKIDGVTYYGSKKEKYFFKLPKGYVYRGFRAGGEGTESQYWYPDSSVIYISDFTGTENTKNIIKQGYNNTKVFMPDTISFNGIDEKGNYWREIKYKDILYGYSNVPVEKTTKFDKIISSIKHKF